MFDTKSLEATPANARRIIQYAKFKNIEISPELSSLASQELVSSDMLKGSNFNIDEVGLEMVQHILDWKGRGMVLDSGDFQSRSAALAAQWIKPSGQVVILTRPNTYAIWANLIRNNWPAASISVFGNPRYEEKNQAYPQGVLFSEDPDLAADWLITSYGSLIWHNVVGKIGIGQIIIEELDNDQSVNYRWDEALRGVLSEIPQLLFLQNILAMDSSASTALNSLCEQNGRLSRHIQKISLNYLWPFAASLTALQDLGSSREVVNYMSGRGYNSLHPLALLPCLGISTAAVSSSSSPAKALSFVDKTVHDVRIIKDMSKTNSPYLRMIAREDNLEAHTGQSIQELVRDCLNGDTRAIELLRGLQTVQYGNLKASFVSQNLDRLASKVSRSLVVCESPDLERSLCVTLKSAQRVTARASDETRRTAIGQYLYPNDAYKQYMDKAGHSLSTLIVDQASLTNEDLIDTTSYLVIADPVMSMETYQFYTELARLRDLRIIHFTLKGTFEEYFFKAFNNLP